MRGVGPSAGVGLRRFPQNFVPAGLNRRPTLYRESRAATLWERLQPRRGVADCCGVADDRGLAARLQAAPTGAFIFRGG